MSPGFSGNAYEVFVEALFPAPSYWSVTLFVVIATLIPYFSYLALQMRFFPMYHELVQWLRYEGKTSDPESVDMANQSSLRPTLVSVGSTARLAARTNYVNARTSNHR
ncbi:hypothetical protein L6164_001812 [Bauhinia variegata]|nr:hypothetical protein L6164_001812 [Bauhinia variegata]